jgi:hypothetical protein
VNAPHGLQRSAALKLSRESLARSVPERPAPASHITDSKPMVERPPSKPRRGSRFEVAFFPLFMLVIFVSLAAGWVFRSELQIEAEEGVGYWLGVAGVSCVGLLLIYPIRKRVPGLRVIGTVPAWFHFHMTLGLLAPTLILFHAGFRTGSANAAIALMTMLVVAGSGIFGRMLYVRIHRNLAGKRAEIKAMAQDAALLRKTLVAEFIEVANHADALEATLRKPRPHVFSAFFYAITTARRISITRGRMLRALRLGARRLGASGQPGGKVMVRRLKRDGAVLVHAYCRQMHHAAYLTFFERLFALWHIMHMPLFFLMVVAAVIHIVAVHLY